MIRDIESLGDCTRALREAGKPRIDLDGVGLESLPSIHSLTQSNRNESNDGSMKGAYPRPIVSRQSMKGIRS